MIMPLTTWNLVDFNEARPRERSDRGRFLPYGQKSLFIMRPFFVVRAKKPLHTGVCTRCHCWISLSVRLSVCVCQCVRGFYWLRELYEANFHKPGIYGSGRVWANPWDVVFRALSRGGHGHWPVVGFVVCFRWGGIYSCFPWVCIFKFVDPEQSVSKGLRQPVNLPTLENSLPPIPTTCTV